MTSYSGKTAFNSLKDLKIFRTKVQNEPMERLAALFPEMKIKWKRKDQYRDKKQRALNQNFFQ